MTTKKKQGTGSWYRVDKLFYSKELGRTLHVGEVVQLEESVDNAVKLKFLVPTEAPASAKVKAKVIEEGPVEEI